MHKLLIQPKPYNDESLASYLHRLCLANKCDVRWLIGKYSSIKKNLYSKLNENNDMELFNSIAEYTNLTAEELSMMTLNKYNYLKNDCLITEIIESPNNSKYCPICLKDEKHQKLYWQLDILKICVKHKILLYRECRKCGRKTDINSVIENTCICGNILSTTPPLYNEYNSVHLNQLKIYRALGINLNSQYNKDDIILPQRYKFIPDMKSQYEEDEEYVKKYMSSFKNNHEYLNLIHVLNHLAETEESSLNLYMNTYLGFSNEVPCLTHILLLERLVDTWPEGFYNMMNNINFKISILYNSRKNSLHFVSSRISPVSCLIKLLTNEFLVIFKDIIINYFITNYRSFYLSFFNIRPNSYISFSQIEFLFSLNYSDVSDLIQSKNNVYIDYNEIQIILDYFMYFITNGTIILINQIFFTRDNEYISLYHLCKNNTTKFAKLNDVLKIIKQNNLRMFINAFDAGLYMVFLLKSEIYKYVSPPKKE